MKVIEDMIADLEKKYHITILYACEAGSRAYGLVSSSSDFDLRFLYICDIEHYLSISKGADTITEKIANIDCHGWDLQKALLLANKSNPTLFEWLYSPIVYKSMAPLINELKGIVSTDYCKKTLKAHYINLANKNGRAFQEKNKTGFLVHALRGALMAEEIIHTDLLPGINLKELMSGSNTFSSEDYSFLEEMKHDNITASSKYPSSKYLLQKLKHLIEELEAKEETKQKINHPDLQKLNALFLQAVLKN
ncbi:putative nucleotidyltransferase [Bacillus sp. THAF10]|uniref:DNA polymerase beta superfamily protein n=1 Tax=Bacillus sp. THAF10 TaxID=2587848 RepID=UPI001268CFDD|nr:nucleotidyltransferase domain-containing protein [Bacillus sp. THAF10]QFT89331.1 putative nucleotidyltransferase [Bacillus sp. THAF10]